MYIICSILYLYMFLNAVYHFNIDFTVTIFTAFSVSWEFAQFVTNPVYPVYPVYTLALILSSYEDTYNTAIRAVYSDKP